MLNFHAPFEKFSPDRVVLEGEEYTHATRSCRVRPGEEIGVTDGRGKRVIARIAEIDSRTLYADIIRDVSGIGEPSLDITVALSIIKPSRFEFAVEKCTELGAKRFVPVIAERSVFPPIKCRIDRLTAIARSAAKQSDRSYIPEILSPVTIDELMEKYPPVFAASASAGKGFCEVLGSHEGNSLTLAIGPEGDFSGNELGKMSDRGAILFSLGGLVLRSETSAFAATSLAVASYICQERKQAAGKEHL